VAQGGDRWTLLSLEGQEIRIFRDAYGVPHVFAPTNRALFYGYGYAIAQDRLWQLDLYRRTARGSLAEILAPPLSPVICTRGCMAIQRRNTRTPLLA